MKLPPEVIEGRVHWDPMENRDSAKDCIVSPEGRTYYASHLLRVYMGKRLRITIEVLDDQ